MTPCIDGTMAHHWRIAPNGNGPTSKGRCTRCRQVREFDNRFVGDLNEAGQYRSSTGRIFYRPNQVPSVGQSKKGTRVLP